MGLVTSQHGRGDRGHALGGRNGKEDKAMSVLASATICLPFLHSFRSVYMLLLYMECSAVFALVGY